jgi:hypothetical protein
MMVTGLALAMVMNMAAAKVDPQDNARKALNNCYVEEHNKAVSAKKTGAEFNEQLAASCPELRKTYFDMVVKAERGFGSKQAEAEEYANGEVQLIIEAITTSFSDNVGTGAQLQKEK